jgi:hypothetical protein
MDRDTWMMAAWIVQQYGSDAVGVVGSKLEKMKQDRVAEDDFRHWCWIARAVIEIIREPRRAEAVH